MLLADTDWVQIVTMICVCFTTVVGPLLGGYLAYKQSQLKLQQDALNLKQEEAKKALRDVVETVEVVHKATNSLTERLEAAALLAGENIGMEKERARVKSDAALMAIGALGAHATEPESIAENVEEVKDDVKIVKSDVADVHATVVEGVKTGVQRGIERGIEEAKEGQ